MATTGGEGGAGYLGVLQNLGQVVNLFGNRGIRGTKAARELRQIQYAMMRQLQQDSLLAARRFRESLSSRYYENQPLTPVIIPDLPPTRLTTRQTNAQQAVIAASLTAGTRDDRRAANQVARADRAIAKWQKKNPNAFTPVFVSH